ncbi:gp293 [Sphingomonas phage PAU]|uniref:gp293 n=1 Tax=Sphingomonas phage PAU TaxID=1150991 RepID=UPI00025734A4|nr:gp293 [Sphingomonas phage PAU]AFF28290.1 gp293 [Sphingomonas phage PAU]
MKQNKELFTEIRTIFWDTSQAYNAKHKLDLLGPVWFNAYDIIAAHTPEVDFDAVAEKCARTHTKPTDKYYGMSKEEILTQWRTKSDKGAKSGNDLDAYNQALFHDKPLPELDLELDIETLEKYRKLRINADTFYSKLNQNPAVELVNTEVWVNEPLFGFRGKMDLLLNNTSAESLLIVDHKQNEFISTTNAYGKFMTGCLSMLPETDLNKMTLQLYAYRYAIEEVAKKKVGSTALAHNTVNAFNLIRPTFDYSKEMMERIFNDTREYVVKKRKAAYDAKFNENNQPL